MTGTWASAFSRSRLAPGLFTVRAEYEEAVAEILHASTALPASRTGVFSPAVHSRAIEDGGVSYYDRYGFGSMPSGYRVIGWKAVRALTDALDLSPPRTAFADETAFAELLEVSEVARPTVTDIESAHLTAYHDGRTLMWVVRRVLGDVWAVGRRRDDAPAAGHLGRLGFSTVGAAVLTEAAVPLDRVIELSALLGLVLLTDAEATNTYNGVWTLSASAIRSLQRLPSWELDAWVAAGFDGATIAAATDHRMQLEAAQAWQRVIGRLTPYAVHQVDAGEISPDDVAPFLDAGVGVALALRLATAGHSIAAVRRGVTDKVDVTASARALLFGTS